jgi:hypothetical protein
MLAFQGRSYYCGDSEIPGLMTRSEDAEGKMKNIQFISLRPCSLGVGNARFWRIVRDQALPALEAE